MSPHGPAPHASSDGAPCVATAAEAARFVMHAGECSVIDNYRVASKGNPINPEQAKMLTHMDLKLTEFAPRIVASYVDGDFSIP